MVFWLVFIGPGGRGFELTFCLGGGEFVHQKIAQGGWSGLELTDTLILGGWVTKILKNGDEKWGGGGVEGLVTTIF